MKGLILILSGPSGVGKDAVLNSWKQVNPRVQRVVACTSRPPRPYEKEGEDYRFMTEDEFLQKASERGFLEHKNVHGYWYGTPSDVADELAAEGKIAILKIDVQGALSVLQQRPEIISVFLDPPSMEELERRLRGRGDTSEEAIQLRLRNAELEISSSTPYRFRIINRDVDVVVRMLEDIVSEAESA